MFMVHCSTDGSIENWKWSQENILILSWLLNFNADRDFIYVGF